MTTCTQTVTLASDQHYGQRVPSESLGRVLVLIQESVRHSIAMAYRGQSVVRGRSPAWLKAAADLRLVGYSGTDETTLAFEAPRLVDAAPSLYQQGEFFWTTRPDGDDTGFDLWGDVLADVAAGREESDRFDPRLLSRLSGFDQLVGHRFRDIRIASRRHSGANAARLDRTTVKLAQALYDRTPSPQAALIVGTLDMLRASTQTFGLKMEGGLDVTCVLRDGDVTDLTPMLKRSVFVSGRAVFRVSGSLLRIEAELVREATGADQFFAKIPKPTGRRLELKRVLHDQRHKRGVAAIFGQWPGDETDEEVEAWLKELS